MKLNSVLLKATVVAALGGLLFGFDTAVISGTTSALSQVFDLSAKSLGITVSIAIWGTSLEPCWPASPESVSAGETVCADWHFFI